MKFLSSFITLTLECLIEWWWRESELLSSISYVTDTLSVEAIACGVLVRQVGS